MSQLDVLITLLGFFGGYLIVVAFMFSTWGDEFIDWLMEKLP